MPYFRPMGTSARPKRSFVDRIKDKVMPGAGRITPGTAPKRHWPKSPFEKWEYDKAIRKIDQVFEAQTIDPSYSGGGSAVVPMDGGLYSPARRQNLNPIEVNRLFFQGDHWQNGDGWIGPHPAVNDRGRDQALQEIASIFTSKNVIKEATMRHALGVVGRTMQWGFTVARDIDPTDKPTDEELKLIQEATSIVRPWLQKRKVQTLLREAVCTLLLSERAGLQLVVPPGLAEDTGDGLVVNAGSVEEGFDYIYIEHPLPDNAAVVTDQDTKTEAGLWRYRASETDEENPSTVEGGAYEIGKDDEDVEYAAICFIDQTGKTIVRIFEEAAEGGSDSLEASYDMGGRLPMFEMRRAALITKQVQQGQRALNLAETMIPRTAITAGFAERLMIDAQAPGEPELDSEGNETGRWIAKPFYVGAGTTNFVQSSEYMDEEGVIKRANAKAVYREPVTAAGPILASDKHYRSILDETGQLHVVMAGDSNPSGTSRLNARIEYISTLQLTQGEVEAAFRFIVDTALSMAEALAKQPGKYTKSIRCQAACRLDPGPLQPAERTAIEASIGKTISRETAMMLVGIEDIEAEMSRMSVDPMSQAAFGTAVGLALQALTVPGASLEGAAAFLGLTEDQVARLMGGALGPAQQGAAAPAEATGRAKDAQKPGDTPSDVKRGPGVGGPEKLPLPKPPTRTNGAKSKFSGDLTGTGAR